MSSSDSPYMVAAIDFGSTHSSYAFSYRHDYLKDPLNINTTVWPGNMDLYTPKAPTVILLDQNLQFVAFGYEAQDVYADKATDKEHEDYRLFQHFTLPFCHPDVEISDDWMISDTHDVEAPAVVVIAEVLKYFHRHLQNTIVKHTGHDETHPVRWVIVVPATWNESARDLLLTAANHAEFDEEHIFIADASEMVLLHTKQIKSHTNIMTRGNRIMTVDLGGGGVEICVYDVWNDKEVEIAHKQYHTRLGSRIVNDLLIVFLAELFNVDYEEFKSAVSTNHLDYLELVRNFEAVKRIVGDGGSKPITLKLPISFKEHIDQVSGLTLEDCLSSSGLQNCVSLVKGSTRMDRQIIDLLFKDLINQTINIVTELDNHFTQNNTKITHIILTGGFSECKLLQTEIKQRLSKVQIPNDSGLSVLKGAVIYGHDVEAVSCLNTAENSVYSYDEFAKIAGSGVRKPTGTENAISLFQSNLQSGLRNLQEEYDEEYHMMCGIDPDVNKDERIHSDTDADPMLLLESEVTMESQIVDEELKHQEEEEIQRQKAEELQKQREAEAQKEREAELERLMIADQERQKQLEDLKRQHEAEAQRQKEIEAQKQREAEAQRQRELEAQRQQEAEQRRQQEAEQQRLRAIEHQRGLAAAAERRKQEELEKKKKKSSVCNLL